MSDGRNTIPAGPGFIGGPPYPNEFSADVELELVYGPKGDTAASLLLFASNVEAPMAETVIGVELTAGDLARLRDWCAAMLAAHDEENQ